MIDDTKYLDAARDGDERSARTAVEDAVFDSLIFYANRNGLKYIEPSDPDALRYHGTSYPTFSLPDRSVSMGVTRTDIYVYKGRVWIGSALERLWDGVVIDAIVSAPGARGQGKASELMKKFMGAAEEAGVFIKLEVAEMSIEVKRGEKKNLNNTQLRSWYERLGFKKVDEHGLIMSWEPSHRVDLTPILRDRSGEVVPLSKRFLSEMKEMDRDAEYLDAVERGDMETAQRLVDEAAKRAGYDVGPMYHGTDKSFNEFKYGGGKLGDGFYFDASPVGAGVYGSKILRVFLKQNNPFREGDIEEMGLPDPEEDGYAFRDAVEGMGYDSIDGFEETVVFSPFQIKSADPVTRDESGNVIPLSKRFNSNSPRITESNDNLLAWFGDSKVRDANGAPLRVYHGTTRPDRVGTRFRKDRATSGPMPFFTDSPDIASGYANKRDNSLTREHEDSSWEDLFYTIHNGKKVTLRNLWDVLDENTRMELEEKLPKITNYNEEDEDDDDRSLHIGTGVAPASNWEYETRRRRNVLLAAVEIWLYSGLIFGDEEVFIDVLETAGLHGVQYEDLNKTYPAIVPVYLRIERPLETVNIPEEVFDALRLAGSVKKRPSRRSPADSWDKVGVDSEEWADRLLWDRENGTTYAWATIPDWVVKVLKSFGYDGVKDVGGKYIGEYGGHTVWIPFDPNQVKSATGNRGTFSRRKNSIVERLLTLLEDITGELDFDRGVTDNLTLDSGGDAVGPEYHGWYAYRYEGKVIAYVNYSYYEGKNYVKMVEVDPKFRNMGVARKLLQVLKAESGNKPIHVFGDVVTDDGAAHLKKMRREGIVSRRSR